jgi:formamidopyrimidine-DNA glycosylase
MPELPEVATLVKSLKPYVIGRRVRHIVAEHSGLFDNADLEDVRSALTDAVLLTLVRHGKYVRIDFGPAPGRKADRALRREPAPGASIVAMRPDRLEDVVARERPGKSGRSRPASSSRASELFEATRYRANGIGVRPASLIVHLRMTGRFYVMKDNGLPVPNRSRFIMAIESRVDDLLFGIKDTRRLARIRLLTGKEAHRWPDDLNLGPDALSGRITVNKISRALKGRIPVKLALLDQTRIAGLGNIYACEVLHRTGIHPARLADDLSESDWLALSEEIPSLMKTAVREWCDLSRWVGPAVEGYGSFSEGLGVYDRKGKPCRICGRKIETIVQGGRTTFFCGTCQK